MKISITLFLALFLTALLVACGGEYKLKVEGIDEVTESGETTSDDGADQQSDGEDDDEDSEDDNDTSGGIEFVQGSKDSERYFMGTFKLMQNAYFNSEYPNRCTYNFPSYTRLYSHDMLIDFEDAGDNLVWLATVYEDETFDFEIKFLNRFGNPSISLICTCFIDPAYYHYYSDRAKCGCEDDDTGETCAVIYEKVDS